MTILSRYDLSYLVYTNNKASPNKEKTNRVESSTTEP